MSRAVQEEEEEEEEEEGGAGAGAGGDDEAKSAAGSKAASKEGGTGGAGEAGGAVEDGGKKEDDDEGPEEDDADLDDLGKCVADSPAPLHSTPLHCPLRPPSALALPLYSSLALPPLSPPPPYPSVPGHGARSLRCVRYGTMRGRGHAP
jgi:hypothetical protein